MDNKTELRKIIEEFEGINDIVEKLRRYEESKSPKRTYVPKEIRLVKATPTQSIGIINPLGQCLYYNTSYAFAIINGIESDNTGDNFYYRKVDKHMLRNVAENVMYLVTDNDDFELDELTDMTGYVIFLSNTKCCAWGERDEGYYPVELDTDRWENYYEIIEEPE